MVHLERLVGSKCKRFDYFKFDGYRAFQTEELVELQHFERVGYKIRHAEIWSIL